MARKSSKKNKFPKSSRIPSTVKKDIPVAIEFSPVDTPAVNVPEKEVPIAKASPVIEQKEETPIIAQLDEEVAADKKEQKEEVKKESEETKEALPKENETEKKETVINKEVSVEKEISVEKAPTEKPTLKESSSSKKTASKPVKEKKSVGRPKKEKTASKGKTKKEESRPTKTETKTANDSFVLQSSGKDYSFSEILDLCKSAYRNGTKKNIKSIDVYVKAENGNLRAYYVVNGKPDGTFIDL